MILEILKKTYVTHDEVMEILNSSDEKIEQVGMSINGQVHYITYDGKEYILYIK